MNKGQKKAPQEGMAEDSFFENWQSWYEKECKPFFNMPQFGLTRYYQEHINQNLDRFSELQGALAEFSSLFGQSVEKSFRAVDKDLFSSETPDKPANAAKSYYSKWIVALEKETMTLFRSPEYVNCLNKTTQTFNDFIISRQTVLEDILKLLPVPTNREMDELYKEIYELKKRVRQMEKEKTEQ